MAKPTIKSNPRVIEIYEDLEKYLEFCQDYGYRYNEADLYNFKSYAFQQFNKYCWARMPRTCGVKMQDVLPDIATHDSCVLCAWNVWLYN